MGWRTGGEDSDDEFDPTGGGAPVIENTETEGVITLDADELTLGANQGAWVPGITASSVNLGSGALVGTNDYSVVRALNGYWDTPAGMLDKKVRAPAC